MAQSAENDAVECMCSVWDEETSTMHRCMWRALDFGCCGKGGPCPCNPRNAIAAQVARYAAEHPSVIPPG